MYCLERLIVETLDTDRETIDSERKESMDIFARDIFRIALK